MINERIALVMLDGELPSNEADPHYTKQLYESICMRDVADKYPFGT